MYNYAHRPCTKNYTLVTIVKNFFVFIQLVIHISVEGEFLNKNHIYIPFREVLISVAEP